MPTSAFAFITSKAVVVRTLASIRSLEQLGALVDSVCYVLCLDNDSYQILVHTTAHGKVTLLTVADLPAVMPLANRPISRFAVACKPYLLRWILTRGGASKALYFDSDIWFTSDPSFLFEDLETNAILLVPFMINAQATIENWTHFAKNAQRTGYFNAGFVGCSRGAMDFLEWWANRCAYSTFRDFYQDISGDQKYLNWVPGLFSGVKILRNYGLNIKPWLTQFVPFERCEDGTATISGDPLVFFHFSQDLGNLLAWPRELYPEVSHYLDELERARIDSGQPYIDMPLRNNSDLIRPLLPRSGKLALLIKALSNYRQPLMWIQTKIRAAIARGTRLLPQSTQSWVAKKYLRRWKLAGDARITIYDKLAERLSMLDPDEAVLFMGASRLGFYLSYLGHPVEMYDPFQGHYNRDLDTLFNIQWSDAQSMHRFLNLEDRLALRRVPISEASRAPAPHNLVISTRRSCNEMADTLRIMFNMPTLKRIIMLFDPAWPPSYREQYQAFIRQAFHGRSMSIEHFEDADLYRVG